MYEIQKLENLLSKTENVLNPKNYLPVHNDSVGYLRLLELIDSYKKEVEIFTSEAPNYFKRVIKYFKYKLFLLAAEKSHCEFHYKGVDLLVGKKTVNGHTMLMVIGNEFHDVGTLHDDHFPTALTKACPSPEETAYSCFLNYPEFEKTCFNTEGRNYYTPKSSFLFERNNQIGLAFSSMRI